MTPEHVPPEPGGVTSVEDCVSVIRAAALGALKAVFKSVAVVTGLAIFAFPWALVMCMVGWPWALLVALACYAAICGAIVGVDEYRSSVNA